MSGSARGIRGVVLLTAALVLLGTAGVAGARAAGTNKLVHYHGYAVKVPRSWPVYDLSRDPGVCVRFDRHALYLGVPGAAQRCPAHAAGRTEAILLSPAPGSPRALGSAAAVSPTLRLAGKSTSFVVAPAAVAVTATWAHDPRLVTRALSRKSLPPAPRTRAAASPRSTTKAHAAGAVYTGLGFDACSTPSVNAMSAWSSSPYRALGVYLGGANEACSQPNLTSSWVQNEVAAGWHLIPTYVGLQAPSNTCGCASITPSQAAAEGAAAADDAISNAQAVAIAPGNPIYFDMEAYSRGGSNTSSVMSFLSAWTSRLHALGYLSGVYSSGGSGMTDLSNAYGTGYVEPDEIWFAEWNGSQSTYSNYVPSADWSNHQRVHQYNGGHNERYGGVTINVDGDYLDGATVGTAGTLVNTAPPLPTTPPSLGLRPAADGTMNFSASWSGASGVTGWRVLGGPNSTSLAGVGSSRKTAAVTHIAIRSAAPYFAVQALGSGNQILGTSPAMPTPAHLVIYGKSAFVPGVPGGVGGLPVGCYTGQRCLVSTTITVGRTVIARTGPEYVGSNGAGLVYFRLTTRGSALLLAARSRRLPVQVSIRDGASGQTASAPVSLVPFYTTGRAAAAHLSQSPAVKVIGLTDFVYGNVGGILAGCVGQPICSITTTLSVGRTVIAQTAPEVLGTNELGYLLFKLTAQGRAMLAHAHGNNLLTSLTLSMPTTASAPASTATANISLVQFR